MTQLQFLSSYARARTTDPVTSHIAERAIRESGWRMKQAEAVLAAVQAHPGCTSAELARLSGLDRYVVARRLPEVEACGHITRERDEHGDPTYRTCAVTGRKAITWRPT